MSHGTPTSRAALIANIRALEAEIGRPLTILADLQGPKLRVGTFAAGKVDVADRRRLRLRPRSRARRRDAGLPAAPGDSSPRSPPTRGC